MALETQRPFAATTGKHYNSISICNIKGIKTKKSRKLFFNYFLYIGFCIFILVIPCLLTYIIWNFIRINALEIELQKLQTRFEDLEKRYEVTQQDIYRDPVSDKLSDIVNRKGGATLKYNVNDNEFVNKTYKRLIDNPYNLEREFYESITSLPKNLQANINFHKDFDKYQSHQKSRRTVHRNRKRSVSRTTIIGDIVCEPRNHERLTEKYQPELRELSDGSLVNHVKIAKPRVHNDNPAAHFHLNSKYTSGKHPKHHINSYGGDIYIGSATWTNQFNFNNYFHLDNGLLTVVESGLYYVYAQICYNNTHNHNGFVVFHGQKPLLQCLSVVPTDLALKTHTCHTSGLIYLNANEHIHLRDLHSERSVILRELNNRSYFGLMKI